MAPALSNTQVDQLGQHLRMGNIKESDLRMLDEYRRSFGSSYETTVHVIRSVLMLEPTGRPAKSTASIIEKLHRESIRLSQVQDIAGCRVITKGIAEQNQVVLELAAQFESRVIVDRRDKPSNDYRAIHVVVRREGKPIEIQVRSALQHIWAELSEKFSDVFDPEIKYGGGPAALRDFLTSSSRVVARIEALQLSFAGVAEGSDALREQQRETAEIQGVLVDQLNKVISTIDKQKKRAR